MKQFPSGQYDPAEKQNNHNKNKMPPLSKGKRRSNLIRPFILAVIGCALLGGAGLAIWHSPLVGAGSAQASGGQKKNRFTSANNTSLFARHASNAGIKSCSDTYKELGEALTVGARYMVQTESAHKNPDQHALQGLVGLNYQGQGDYSGHAVGLVFVAPVTGSQNCEGTMLRVVPFQKSCQAAANLLPAGSKQGQSLMGLPVFELPNSGYAMLMPSGEGCVVLSVVRGAGS
ncbi:hypothetical protein [Pseudochrobactrum sp. HB0163]|uniref:hypothetical protein n=1 Tax=Pseudochrobactrum sp. HB0163 TaxID=3450708 RepID=UPI003F6DC2F4